MQLHLNDQPTNVKVDELSLALDHLHKWQDSWRTAEWWEKGKCIVRAMRIPTAGYDTMVVVTYTEYPPNGSMFSTVTLLNVTDGCQKDLLDGYEVF